MLEVGVSTIHLGIAPCIGIPGRSIIGGELANKGHTWLKEWHLTDQNTQIKTLKNYDELKNSDSS